MLQIFVVSTICVLFFLLWKWNRHDISWLSFVFMFQATAQWLLVQHDIGPVSLRVYNSLLMGILVLYFWERCLHVIKRVNGLGFILFLWFLFLGWSFVASFLNGSADNISFYFKNFSSKYVMATLSFFAAITLLRTKGDVYVCMAWLGFIGLANGVVVMMQALGGGIGWKIHAWINPVSEMMLNDLRSRLGDWAILGYPPGLCNYSIETGYVLLCFGLIVTSLIVEYWKSKHYLWSIIATSAFAITVGGIIFCMSRSSLILSPFLLIIALLWRGNFKKNHYGLASLMIAVCVAALFGVFAIRGINVNVSESRVFELERIFSLESKDRLYLASQSLSYIAESPLFGGLKDAMDSGSIEMVPHNFILNAALYYGIIGAFLILIFTGFLIYLLWSHTWGQGPRYNFIPAQHTLSVCILAYLLKGVFHNDSFVIGGLMGWYLLGLWVSLTYVVESDVIRNRVFIPFDPMANKTLRRNFLHTNKVVRGQSNSNSI